MQIILTLVGCELLRSQVVVETYSIYKYSHILKAIKKGFIPLLYNINMAKIISDSKILSGKPVIAGTRISVELIMNFLGAGMSVDDILKEYPELKKSEVLAAIDYVKKLVRKYETREEVPVTLHEITR